MATTSTRFEFFCGPNANLIFHHDLPTSLLQASSAGPTPAFRQAYVQAVAPIMRERQEICLKSSQAKCSVCETGPTKNVLTTPISWLHLKTDPKVVVIVTPVCEKQQCHVAGKVMVEEMVKEVTDGQQMEFTQGMGGQQGPTARGAPCPCGSSRKFKKCCGLASAQDDVD